MRFNWQEMSKKQRRIATCGAIALGLIISTCITVTNGNLVGRTLELVGVDTPKTIVDRHLDWAEIQSLEGIDRGLLPIRAFFEEARQHTYQFAEETLSFESKWKLATDFVTQRGEHSQFIQEKFDSLIFSQAQLKQLVESVVANYLRHLEDVESQMLVRMKADLAQVPEGSAYGAPDYQLISQRLDVVMQSVVAATKADLAGDVGVEVVSWIAGDLVQQAAIHLATSTGILGTGALSGPASLGVTLVLSLAVDQLVSEIYNQTVNPKGKLSDTLNAQLAEMERLILEGTPEAPGLIVSLSQFSAKRGSARRDAVHGALLQQSF